MEINDLRELAEKHLFTVFQQEAGSYINQVQGKWIYTLKKENIMYVEGRETENGATVFKLVPPSIMLHTKKT